VSRSAEFPGVTERLREALRARGYWNLTRDTPAAARFCRMFPHYDEVQLAMWCHRRRRKRPKLWTLRRLAQDLEIPLAYLLLGDMVFEAGEWTRLVAQRRRWIAKPGNRSQRRTPPMTIHEGSA
jgi:hypothetical protein